MTARISTCNDLASNEADLKKLGGQFMTLQTSVTPTSLILPWFPSPARRTVKQVNTEMFTMLYAYIETRRHAELTGDAIDIMIADGETTQNIIWVSPVSKVMQGVTKSDPMFSVHYGGAFRYHLQRRHHL